VGDELSVKAQLVRINNYWGNGEPPIIKVSLYCIEKWKHGQGYREDKIREVHLKYNRKI